MITPSNHPYIGLRGRVRASPFSGPDAGKNDYTGTVVAVGQGGSTVEEGGAAFVALAVLRDEEHPLRGWHDECDIFRFTPTDPAEARRRLAECGRGPDRWQDTTVPLEIDGPGSVIAPPAGYEPVGPWKSYGIIQTDNGTLTAWCRPLRRVGGGA